MTVTRVSQTNVIDPLASKLDLAGGKILQVASTAKTDTFTASLATATTATITGLSVSITPSLATSKILVQLSITAGAIGADIAPMFILERAGSPIGVGDAASARARVTMGADLYNTTASLQTVATNYLDSPATTSAITYTVDVMHTSLNTNTVWINRSQADNDLDRRGRAISTITVMEVSA